MGKKSKYTCINLLNYVMLFLVISSCQFVTVKTVQNIKTDNVELMTSTGHLGSFVQARDAEFKVQYSEDSNLFISNFGDNIIKKWDVPTGRLLKSINIHIDNPQIFSFSPNAEYIASGHEDGTIRIWDMKTGSELKSLLSYDKLPIYIAFSESGNMLVSHYLGGLTNIWHIPSGTLKGVFETKDQIINTKFVNNDRAFITVLRNGKIIKWDIHSKKIVKLDSIKPYKDDRTIFKVVSVNFWNDENAFVVESQDDDFYLFDSKYETSMRTICRKCYGLSNAIFSNDGTLHFVDFSVSNKNEKQLNLNLKGRYNYEVHKIEKNNKNDVLSIKVSPDGQTLITAFKNGSMKLWDTKQDKLNHVFEGQGLVYWTDFSNDLKAAVILGEDNVIKIINIFTGKVIQELKSHESSVHSFQFSKNNKMAVSSSEYPAVILWDLKKGKEINKFGVERKTEYDLADSIVVRDFENKDFESEENDITTSYSASITSDGSLIAANSESQLYIWDSKSGELMKRSNPKLDTFHARRKVSFAPDGKQLISICKNGLARVWDKHTNSITSPLGIVDTSIFDMVFSSDGKFVAFGSELGETIIYKTVEWDKKLTIEGHNKRVSSLRFTNDGEKIIIGYGDGVVKIVDVNTSIVYNIFNTKSRIIRGTIGFFPDNNFIIIPTFDSLRYFDIDNGEMIAKVFVTHNGEWAVTAPDKRYEKSKGFRMYWKDGVDLHRVEDLDTGLKTKNLLEGILKKRKPSKLFSE